MPETDMEGFYNTSLPVFLFKMTDQNLQVAAKAGDRIKLQVSFVQPRFLPTDGTGFVCFLAQYFYRTCLNKPLHSV